MLIRFRLRPPDCPWRLGEADIDPRLQHLPIPWIINLQHHLYSAGVGMLEPFCTGATYRTLAASSGYKVFPLLSRAGLEELAGSLLMFGEQRRVMHDALDIRKTFLVPIANASSHDEFPEILVARAAKLHPTTVRTLKTAPPD